MSRTVKEVLSERIPGHELGHQEPLVSLAAASDEVGESSSAELPHRPGFLLRRRKLIRIKNDKDEKENRERGRGELADGRGTGGRRATQTY